jgi:hypothetical protein
MAPTTCRGAREKPSGSTDVAVEKAADAVLWILDEGVERAMNRFNAESSLQLG